MIMCYNNAWVYTLHGMVNVMVKCAFIKSDYKNRAPHKGRETKEYGVGRCICRLFESGNSARSAAVIIRIFG